MEATPPALFTVRGLIQGVNLFAPFIDEELNVSIDGFKLVLVVLVMRASYIFLSYIYFLYISNNHKSSCATTDEYAEGLFSTTLY